MSPITHIEFVYPPNGERKTMPIEVITKTYVSVRWGMSGTYDLNLLKNVLTARSQKSRRRSKCLWVAVDIMAVREMVNIYFDKEHEKTKRQIADHMATMPGIASASYPRAKRLS